MHHLSLVFIINLGHLVMSVIVVVSNSKAKGIRCFCLSSNGAEILLGTDNEAVYILDVASFDLSSKAFAFDVLLEK